MSFEWKVEYEVGNLLMDEEHKVLVDLIDQFENSLAIKDGQVTARQALGALNEYIRLHFTVEEELMRIYRYPQLSEHRAMHDAFRKSVAAYNASFQEGEMEIVHVVVNFLKKWLTGHIREVDRELSDFLAGKGLK